MSISRLPSELFERAWSDYQAVCRRDGMVALNRFCESRDVPVQRLYEWLRRRHISVKEFQAKITDEAAGVTADSISFEPVILDEVSDIKGVCYCTEGVRIELPYKRISVNIGRMTLPALTQVLNVIKDLQ